MSIVTPRDRLQRISDLARKTLRYWYLLLLFPVIGAGLAIAFATVRPKAFQSYAVLFYQERIQTSLLNGRAEEVQRNIGDRYRELLTSRAELEPIIKDPKLDPYPSETDDEAAIDKLRQAIRFESRGANVFRISYADSDPDRCKAIVAQLTDGLRAKDEALRNEQAQATVDFADKQKAESAATLKTRERALIDFLSKHPEFVADPNQPQGEGAGIRGASKPKQATGGSTSGKLLALQRQASRIQIRLNASPDAPPIRVTADRTPEQKAADAAVAAAQKKVIEAQEQIEAAIQHGYTERHPEMIKATQAMDDAKQRLAVAKAAVPPDVETLVVPASAEDRANLQKQLNAIESEMDDEERRIASGNKGPVAHSVDDETEKIVQLESQHDDLQRSVDEQRKTDATLADSVYRAKIDAAQKLAEQDRLTVLDGAFKPTVPTGPPKSIFLIAGVVLFLGLGSALAVGLALIDDRLYRRHDIDELGIVVLGVIPPFAAPRAGRKKGKSA
jgi:capsular polysaccharide biosynthesis protein